MLLRLSSFIATRRLEDLATAVAATTSTVSASTATTTATASASAVTSAAATALFAGTGFVDGQRASAVILLMQSSDRFVGGIVIPHLHETETFAPTGVPVLDDLSTLHRAELAEQGLQV